MDDDFDVRAHLRPDELKIWDAAALPGARAVEIIHTIRVRSDRDFRRTYGADYKPHRDAASDALGAMYDSGIPAGPAALRQLLWRLAMARAGRPLPEAA